MRELCSGDGTLSSLRGDGIMFEPQEMSDRPVDLAFLHRAGTFFPPGIIVSVRGRSEW